MGMRFEKLKRIIRRLRGSAEVAVAVPYEIQCDCGARVSGMRRSSWIEAECSECCDALFVLPANVYPSTPSVPSEVLGGRFADRLKHVLRELFPQKKDQQPAEPKETSVPGEAAAIPVRRWTLPTIDLAGMLRRTFTPFRMLMLAVILVAGLTGVYMIRQRAIEHAQQVWLQSPETIQRLMQESDFARLPPVLSETIEAGRVLQKTDDPEWRLMENLLQETVSVNTIASADLLSAFHRAYDDRGKLTDGAEHLVSSACQGTFFFDTHLQTMADSPREFQVEFPASPGTHSVVLTIEQPRLAAFLEAFSDGRCLFAAKIASAAGPQSEDNHRWQLQLDPDSFVLLTSSQHADAIGLATEFDPNLTAILDRQKDFVETSDRWQNAVTADGMRVHRSSAESSQP